MKLLSKKGMKCGEKQKNRLRIFIQNGLLLTAVSLFMRFVGVSFQLFITEHAGSEAVGLYSVIGGVYGFLVTLATSGIQLGTTRMISEALGRDDPGEVKESRRLCLLYALFFGTLATMILFFGAEPIGTFLLKDERTVRSLRILSLSLLPIALSSVLNGYFTAVRRVYKNALTGMLEQGIRIGITVVLLLYVLPRGIESACIALVLGSALSEMSSAVILGVLFFLEQKKYRKSDSLTPRNVLGKRLLGISLPVAFSAYARSGLLTIEHMLIPIGLTAFFGDRSEALSAFGVLHGVALPILLFPSALLSSYSGLLVPEIAECKVRGQKEKLEKIITVIFRGALLFSVGVAGILLCFSRELASMMQNGAEAAYYLAALAPLIPIMYLDNTVDAMLKGYGEQVYCMQVNIFDSLLSVILVWLLLPRMGMRGYILVIYVTELLNASLSVSRLLTVTSIRLPLVRFLFVPLLSVIGATAIVRSAGTLAVRCSLPLSVGMPALVLHILVSVIFYIALLFPLGGIHRAEIRRALFRIGIIRSKS